MLTKLENLLKNQFKTKLPEIRPGDTVKIYQKIKEKDKERIQVFEGQVLARKHGKGLTSTITVRKLVSGIGVEKIFPLHSPTIDKIEVVKRGKVRRAKLYYLRGAKGKKARLKKKEFAEIIPEAEPQPAEEIKEEVSEAEPQSTEEPTEARPQQKEA